MGRFFFQVGQQLFKLAGKLTSTKTGSLIAGAGAMGAWDWFQNSAAGQLLGIDDDENTTNALTLVFALIGFLGIVAAFFVVKCYRK